MSRAVTTVEVGGRSLNIARTLGEINLDNLTGEVQSVGGESIWWGILAAQAAAETRRQELALDIIRAGVARRIRTDARLDTAKGEAKLTEAGLVECIALDETFQKATLKHIDAEEKSDILRSVRFAIEQKARTLEKLSGPVGQEYRAGRPPQQETTVRRTAAR